MNTHFKVKVDNYHAQIKRADWVTRYASRHEAAEAIYSAFFERIADEAATKANDVVNYDDDESAWNRENERQLEDAMKAIEEFGYEDGDGHRYFIEEVKDEDGE